MKINKEKLEALAALPDDELWGEVKKMAKGYGINLPSETPSHAELENLREVARGDKINIGEAMRLVNDYRRKNGI